MHPEQNYSTPNSPNDYDFIVNPAAVPRRSLQPNNSMLSRIVIALAGLCLLLIIVVGVKSLFSTDNSNLPALVAVVVQQQELIHITHASAEGPQPMSDANRNIVVTTDLSLTSAQSQLLAYVKTQNKKIPLKQISIYPGGKAIDDQLAASIAASNYDVTLHEVIKAQLTSYQSSLKQAYAKTTGTKGRELLNKQYDGAGLLLRQLGTN